MEIDYRPKVNSVIDQVNKTILGKHDIVTEVLLAILAGGHVLLEDMPGVGKTTLALAIANSMNLDFNRVQFTPDTMPSDITGYSMYNQKIGDFVYKNGAAICNLMLADEINRTSPKTQSALLEVMEEHKISVDGKDIDLPNPFIVIATQNPLGSAGTQMLPESQLDRFMIATSIGYPSFEFEVEMAKSIKIDSRASGLESILSPEDLINIQNQIHNVFIHDEIYRYIISMISSTRENGFIRVGASPRATVALVKMTKSTAWLDGRDYVIPADVDKQFKPVISHRIQLNQSASINNKSKDELLDIIIKNTRKPSLKVK